MKKTSLARQCLVISESGVFFSSPIQPAGPKIGLKWEKKAKTRLTMKAHFVPRTNAHVAFLVLKHPKILENISWIIFDRTAQKKIEE